MASIHSPVSRDGWARRICKWVVKAADGWFVKFFLTPLLVTALPGLIVLAITRDQFKQQVEGIIGAGNLPSSLWIIVGLTLCPIAVKALWAFVEKYSNPERALVLDDVLLLLEAVRTVVGEKLDRFTAEAKKAKRNPTSSGEIFASITQPEVQIRALVKAAHAIFNALDVSTTFRVGLLKVDGGRPSDWVAYFPNGKVARTTAEALQAPTSTVMRAIKKKTTIVVDDIQKELVKASKNDRNYIRGASGDDPGSQLCYPIIDTVTREVCYVLTIAGGKAGSLKASRQPIYEWLIEQLATRIQLEHCLVQLVESSHADKKAA